MGLKSLNYQINAIKKNEGVHEKSARKLKQVKKMTREREREKWKQSQRQR